MQNYFFPTKCFFLSIQICPTICTQNTQTMSDQNNIDAKGNSILDQYARDSLLHLRGEPLSGENAGTFHTVTPNVVQIENEHGSFQVHVPRWLIDQAERPRSSK